MKEPRRTMHPGEELAVQLAELDLNASEFARIIRVPKNRVTLLLRGERSITADTALRLSRFFGMTAMYWMNLQSRYDLVQAHPALKQELRKLPSIKEIRDAMPRA